MSEPMHVDGAILAELGAIIRDHMQKAYTPEILRGIVAREIWGQEQRRNGEPRDGFRCVQVIPPIANDSGVMITATLIIDYALPENVESNLKEILG